MAFVKMQWPLISLRIIELVIRQEDNDDGCDGKYDKESASGTDTQL